MQSRGIFALSAVVVAFTPVNSGLAQQNYGDLLPPPSAPGSLNPPKAFQATSPFPQAAGRRGSVVNSAPVPIHDGWGGYAAGPIKRLPLAAPPEPAQMQSPGRHFTLDADLPPETEYLGSGVAEGAEKFDWKQFDDVSPNGDFARTNSAEKQIGWVARGKSYQRVAPRRPAIDLKAMTRLKLNESGSTVFDITKGAVVTKF